MPYSSAKGDRIARLKCGQMYAKVLLLVILLLIALVPAIAAPRYLLPQRGADAMLVAVSSGAYIIYSIGASILLASLSRSILVGLASAISFAILSPPSLLAYSSVMIAAGSLLAIAFQRERLGEPLLDLLRDPASYSPAALATAALSLYLVDRLFVKELGCPQTIAFYAFALLSAAAAAIASEELYESVPLGALAGLGPVGLALVALYASYKPIRGERCEGIEVGVLIGLGGRFSATRSLVRLRDGQGSHETIACVREERAVITLKEPWILWIYGERAEEIAGHLSSRLGGFYVVRLRRVSEEAAEGLRLGDSIWLDLSATGITESSLSIVYELAAGARRVIVTSNDIPPEGMPLAPRGPAVTAGFIVAGLKDLSQADRIARLISEAGREDVRNIIARGEELVAYPSCRGTPLLFKKG